MYSTAESLYYGLAPKYVSKLNMLECTLAIRVA